MTEGFSNKEQIEFVRLVKANEEKKLKQTVRMATWKTCCVNSYDMGHVVCRAGGCGRNVR